MNALCVWKFENTPNLNLNMRNVASVKKTKRLLIYFTCKKGPLPCLLTFPRLDNLKKTYLNRFSAPALSISSLLMSMLSLDLLDCSLPRHVAARGSDPCKKNKKCYRFWFWESFILSSLGRLHHLRLDMKYPMKYCTKLCRIAKHVINALDNSHNNAINS